MDDRWSQNRFKLMFHGCRTVAEALPGLALEAAAPVVGVIVVPERGVVDALDAKEPCRAGQTGQRGPL